MINGFDFVDTTDTAKPDATPPEIAMHTDLQRLRKGRVGAPFWSVYVPSNPDEPQAVQQTIAQIDVMKRPVARYPDDLLLASSPPDLAQEMKPGSITRKPSIEGDHSMRSSLAVLPTMN